MNGWILLLLLVIVLLLLLGILFLITRKKPHWLAPIVNLFARTRFGKKHIARAVAKQDLEVLQESLAEDVGRQQSRQVAKILAGKNEADRTRLIEDLMSGEVQLGPEMLERSKTKDQGRAAQKKKEANRRKRKQARKQNRRKR